MKKTYSTKAKVWLYPGNAPWHFVTLPIRIARDIDDYFYEWKRGWGSLPVIVKLGKTSWKTSIFTDKQSASYILPLKADVRKKEGIKDGDTISFSLELNTR